MELLTLAINSRLFGYFWLVSTTQRVKNVIAGVNDTSDKLTTEVCSFCKTENHVARTPKILQTKTAISQPCVQSAYRVQFGFLIRMCGVPMDAPFQGGSNETIGARVRLRQPEISPFWFELVLAASGAPDQGA